MSDDSLKVTPPVKASKVIPAYSKWVAPTVPAI